MLIDVQLENKALQPHLRGLPINEGGLKSGVKAMTQVIATTQNHRWLSGLMPRMRWFGVRDKREMLDVSRLSDHLRRDMGFLDGNDPSGRHS